jgi:dihydrofolate reductase
VSAAQVQRVSLIVAMARNRVIGRDNRLPWHLPDELKRFKALTMGHHIVMGRRTWDSIRRLLPGRTTVIVTRDADLRVAGAKIAHSFEEALRLASGDPEVFVIGGAQIFRDALRFAQRIYLTTVETEIEGDTHMPDFDRQAWRVACEETHPQTDTNPLPWTLQLLERVGPLPA